MNALEKDLLVDFKRSGIETVTINNFRDRNIGRTNPGFFYAKSEGHKFFIVPVLRRNSYSVDELKYLRDCSESQGVNPVFIFDREHNFDIVEAKTTTRSPTFRDLFWEYISDNGGYDLPVSLHDTHELVAKLSGMRLNFYDRGSRIIMVTEVKDIQEGKGSYPKKSKLDIAEQYRSKDYALDPLSSSGIRAAIA